MNEHHSFMLAAYLKKWNLFDIFEWISTVNVLSRVYFSSSSNITYLNWHCRDGSSARMTYEVQGRLDGTHSDPVISVTPHGQVISGSHTGQASLLITALEDFGVNQSVVILVKVTDHSTFMYVPVAHIASYAKQQRKTSDDWNRPNLWPLLY